MGTEPPVIITIPPEALRRRRHPEWIIMHLNGVTPAQIAALVHQEPPRVRDYLGAFARSHPELFARRLMLHDRPQPRPATAVDRDREWKHRLHQVMAFQLQHGRRPQHAATEEPEMLLGQWITFQRSDARLGQLAGHRIRWMEENVPDWRTCDRDLAAAKAWHQQLTKVQSHLHRTGEWPRAWNRPKNERRLATWLQRQRRLDRNGNLPAERSNALNQTLPGWDQRPAAAG